MRRAAEALLARRIDHALDRREADLVIKNVTVLNVRTGSLRVTDIAMTGDTIVSVYESARGKRTIDGTGLFAVPGFINTHLHVESSLLTPNEFERMVLPRGTTTAICDPHEIGNVLGKKGVEYFLRAANHTLMNLIVNLPSCVPATKLETSGAELDAETLAKYKDHLRTRGLAEFMDVGAVMRKEQYALSKLAAFQGSRDHIDGHMPNVRGRPVNALLAVGIRTDHESTDMAQALEKLEKGIFVQIRYGTICKDLDNLAGLINPKTAPYMGFCTDDLKLTDIAKNGEMDHIIRTAIAKGADMLSVYRMATLSAATEYHIDRKHGLIASGHKANIVLLSNLEQCKVEQVVMNGQPVTDEKFENRRIIKPVGYNSVKLKEVSAEDFAISARAQPVPVIGLIENQIVTRALEANVPANRKGELQADPSNDILKIAVLERHGKNGNIGRGFVTGFGLKEGAIASTVGHDSHNITVVGATDKDMAVAVNRLREIQGGFVVVKDGKVTGEVPLRVAGLQSDKKYEEVLKDMAAFNEAVAELKPAVANSILYTAFLPLPVIPTLRLTDHGLTMFDPAKGDEGPHLVDDQRPKQRGKRHAPAAALS